MCPCVSCRIARARAYVVYVYVKARACATTYVHANTDANLAWVLLCCILLYHGISCKNG